LKVLVLRENKLHGHIANLKIKNPFPSLVIFEMELGFRKRVQIFV